MHVAVGRQTTGFNPAHLGCRPLRSVGDLLDRIGVRRAKSAQGTASALDGRDLPDRAACARQAAGRS